MPAKIDGNRWRHIEKLFDAARERPIEARAAFLDEACCGDLGLRREVESLLAHDSRNPDFLETPALTAARVPLGDLPHETEVDPMVGVELGAYRIEGRIASGGMGAVYLGVRADREIDRRVAIKLIKRGMDTDELVQRFRIERQVLAGFEHPNIAKLLDAGSTADGRPYYVMDFIEGRPVTTACDARSTSLEERLRLFEEICEAVQYAHRNLVVHRDLKPNNILVDRAGKPVLLDFGIAKLLGPRGDETTATQRASRLLTPHYTSPEQARGERTTTASDVYSLGVLLYELLTGCLPYEFAAEATSDQRLAAYDRPPCPPSEAAIDTEIAAARDTSERKLRRRLRGDLDNIVLAALRREPERRYVSAERLAEDVRRHLRGMPVRARPDTLRYRLRKFVLRHRVAAALAIVAFVGISAGFFTTLWQSRIARIHARNAERVTRLLVEIFSAVDPLTDKPVTSGRKGTLTALELLDLGTSRIRNSLDELPWIRARLLHAFGQIYQNLGAYRRSVGPLEEAIRIRFALGGEGCPDVAASRSMLALTMLRRNELEKAERLLRESLAVLTRELDPSDPLLGHARNTLGTVLWKRGDAAGGERIFHELLAERRKRFGPESPAVAATLNNLAILNWDRGHGERSRQLFLESLAIKQKTMPADHPDLAETKHNLGYILVRMGAPGDALPLLEAALESRKARFVAQHPAIARSQQTIAEALLAVGRASEAEAAIREAVSILEHQFTKRHWYVADARTILGETLLAQDRLREAERELEPNVAKMRKRLGDTHEHAREGIARLAALYDRTDRKEEAQKLRDLLARLPKAHH